MISKVQQHYEEVKMTIAMCQEDINHLKNIALTVLNVVADNHYKDGIMSIEAAFDTFMDIGDGENALEDKMMEFRTHKFELEKEYRHHMNSCKIQEYLQFVSGG